jgi:adenylate cyclase
MPLIKKHKAAGVKSPPSPSQVRRLCFGVAMLAYLVIVILYFIRPQVLIDIEGRLLDARFKLRGAQPPTGAVAIVAVDEKSISEVGRWPWSREVTAKLIEQVDRAGAAAIGLDIVFSEPQQEGFLQRVEALQGLSASARAEIRAAYDGRSPDEVLARTIADSGKVVNGQFFYLDATKVEQGADVDSEEQARVLASSTVAAVRSTVEAFPAWEAVAARPNIVPIADAGRGAGYFNFSPGHDGLLRYAPLVMRYGDEFYPLLALQTLALYLDDAPIVVQAEEFGISQINVGELPVITDELGSIAVNYRGPQQTIPTYSAVDLLEGRVPPELLEGRMVLIGVTPHSAPSSRGWRSRPMWRKISCSRITSPAPGSRC